jgi:hypothetical protein
MGVSWGDYAVPTLRAPTCAEPVCDKLPADHHRGFAMRRPAAALMLLALAAPAWAGQAPAVPAVTIAPLQDVLTMRVDSRVTLDAKGGLVSFSVETPIPENVRSKLDNVVQHWRFAPVLADGVARQVTTRMRITLAATRDGENYRVKVDNVIFPGDAGAAKAATRDATPDLITGKHLLPPGYPLGLMRQGVSGTVLLGMRVGADGRVEEVVSVQSALKDVRGRPEVLAKAIKLFEQSATTAARRWTFNVPANLAALTPSDRTVVVPVNYIMDREEKDAPGQWRTEVRTARRDMAWLDGRAGLQHAGVSDVADGETIAVASTVRLETDVVGAVIL